MKNARKYNSKKATKTAIRNKMKSDGFFDGRFKPKVVKDKKKEQDRLLCKQKIKTDET